MEFALKNVILYDEFGNVSGFAEFKLRRGYANVKVRHSLAGKGLSFAVIADGEPARTVELTGAQTVFELAGGINAETEIFCVISARDGSEKTLASGVVNEAKLSPKKPKHEVKEECHAEPAEVIAETGLVESRAALQELDEALRKVCVIDENGRGQCESCPYREHFFGAPVGEDEVVV